MEPFNINLNPALAKATSFLRGDSIQSTPSTKNTKQKPKHSLLDKHYVYCLTIQLLKAAKDRIDKSFKLMQP